MEESLNLLKTQTKYKKQKYGRGGGGGLAPVFSLLPINSFYETVGVWYRYSFVYFSRQKKAIFILSECTLAVGSTKYVMHRKTSCIGKKFSPGMSTCACHEWMALLATTRQFIAQQKVRVHSNGGTFYQ